MWTHILFGAIFIHSTGGLIRSGLELYCDFENGCDGWRNGTTGVEDSGEWAVSSSVILDAWHSLPRPYQGYHLSYAVGDGGERVRTVRLVSDTLPCLLVPSYLTFYFWKNTFLSGLFRSPTPSIRLLRQTEEEQGARVLGELDLDNRWGWRFAALEVPPSNSSFQLIIEASVQNTYDLVALDAIVFRGYVNKEYCNLPRDTKAKMSRKPHQKNSQLPFVKEDVHRRLAHKPPRASNEVNEIEERETESSAVGETATRFLGSMMESLARTIIPRVFAPDPTSPPSLFVTARPPQVPEQPFRREEIQEIEPSFSVQEVTQKVADERESCDLVSCGFEGSSCRYEGTEGENGAWVIMQGRIGNPLTGISRAAFGLFYAVAYSSEGKSTQILRSPPFRTEQPTYLTFWYYFASANSGRLVVCDRDLDNCLWEESTRSVGAQSRKWRRAGLPLPSGSHQVLFVIEDLDQHYYAGLDHVVLRRNGQDGPPANCLFDV